jgi:hypothetical protein
VQDYIAEGEIARQFQVQTSSHSFLRAAPSEFKYQIESAAEDALHMQKNHAAALAHMTVGQCITL